MNKWHAFFQRISIDYFGDMFVEFKVLKQAMEKELSDECAPWIRKYLYYIFNYEGQTVISEPDFMRIMRTWATFTANDINRDNVLDIREV